MINKINSLKEIWNKLSFRNKILICFLLIIFILSGLSLLLSQYISDVSFISKELVDESIPEFIWLYHWQKELFIKRFIFEQLLEGEALEQLDLMYGLVLDGKNPAISGDVPISLLDIKNDIEQIDFVFLNKVRGLMRYNSYETAKTIIQLELLPLLSDVEQRLEQRHIESTLSLTQKSWNISTIIHKSLWALLIIATAAILLSIYFSYKISLGITRPIDHLITKVGQISKGKYGLQVSPIEQYELQRLTTSINQMSSHLQESFDTVYKEKLLREKILAYIPIGIITVNDDKSEVQVNDKAKELIGLNEETLQQVLNGHILCKKNQEFWSWYHSNEFYQTRKTVLKSFNQSYQILVSQSPLQDQTETIVGRIFYFIDISEIDALEKRIYRSEKLAIVGELAAGSAHEIRNPLAVIHGFVQLIHTNVTEEERKKYHLSLLLQELDRINKIVENMLLLAKPGAPQLKYGLFEEEVLHGIMPLIDASCPSRVRLKVELDPFYLCVDSEQMKQVFYNLIRNSVEAISGDGEIRVYSQMYEDKVCIFIEDNGPGIQEDILSQIFEPFVSSKEKGTGLGLTIIQRIIENHGGEIELVSSSEQGTSFKITLPLKEDQQ